MATIGGNGKASVAGTVPAIGSNGKKTERNRPSTADASPFAFHYVAEGEAGLEPADSGQAG